MRVTSEMMVHNTLRRLSGRLERYQHVQSRLAAGRRILAPSDDPSGAARALSLRAGLRSREQEVRNAADAQNWLAVADGQLQASMERLARARDLALRGSSSVNADEFAALAKEVATIRDELVGIANARQRGRPLFSGYADTDAVARVAGTWTYQGDDGAILRRVGEQENLRVNVSGGAAFGFDAGRDVFTVLDELEQALQAGDSAGTAALIADIDGGRQRIGDALATVGATANWVDSALARAEDAQLATRAQLAEVEDVDIAEAIMDLQTQQVAYEATLQALARALPPSLASFLR